MDLDLSLTRIEEAARTIDPVFLNTPQYGDEQLNAALGRNVVVKVEIANPLRSFKGRGADFFMGQLDGRPTVVCSSTGNFGQAIAFAGRRRDMRVEVFVPENINPIKLARMRSFGARGRRHRLHGCGRSGARPRGVAEELRLRRGWTRAGNRGRSRNHRSRVAPRGTI